MMAARHNNVNHNIMGVIKPLLKLSNQMMNYFTTCFNPSVNRLVNECLASLSLELELLDVETYKLPVWAVKSTSSSLRLANFLF